ncbi:MAG: rRNA maturation RNase YbeY [Peptostreptococcaceae bacterium]|nr:rRNA maturation RNase YbeY [Peptostreptococcaceae bacterium]
MIDIISSNEQEKYEISEELMKKIESVIKECENEEEIFFDNEISITFTDNENIRQINNDYRQKDVETDVLSFPIYEKYELDEEKNIESDFIRPLGDIVISMEKADEQSKDFGHSFEREVCYLVCHSMFHLMGYDHIQEDEKKIMREKEEKVMDKLNITR